MAVILGYTSFVIPSIMKLRNAKDTLRKISKPLFKSAYPKGIINIENILKNYMETALLHTINTDGRINSIYDENAVIKLLESHYGNSYIQKPSNTRHWYDLKIKSSDIWIPCNIKVSIGGTDNALCKKALVYSLTDLSEDKIPKYMSFNKMIELIESNKNATRNCNKEYYYIYVDKKDGSILVRSLCDIKNYVSNPQNWLQINWKKEKTTAIDSHEDIDAAYFKLRSTLSKSLQKIIDSSNKLL